MRGPVVKTIPDGLLLVDREYTPCLIASVSYCCGPGCSSQKLTVLLLLPLLDDGLAEDGLPDDCLDDGLDDGLAEEGRPKVTDCMLLLLVNIIPLRMASGSYVWGPTPGCEQDFLSESDLAVPNLTFEEPLLVKLHPLLMDSGSYSEGPGESLLEGLSALHARVALPKEIGRLGDPLAAKIFLGQYS